MKFLTHSSLLLSIHHISYEISVHEIDTAHIECLLTKGQLFSE